MRESLLETIVGLLVVAVAAIFLVFSMGQRSEAAPRDSYTLTASFFRADGINVGSDVRLAGQKIGVVSDIAIDPKTYQAILTFTLPRTVQVGEERLPLQIPDDSTAQVQSDGLLGGAYIGINVGGSFDYLAEGARMEYTRPSIDLLTVLSELGRAAAGGGGDAEPSTEEVP